MALGSKPLGIILGLLLLGLLIFMECIPYLGGPPASGEAPTHAMVFGKQFAQLPPWVKIWMVFQDLIIASSLWFVLWKKEAQVYVLAPLASHAFLFPVMPMVPIESLTLGFAALSHFFWIPALIYLVWKWPTVDKNSPFGMWMTVAIAQLAFSLIFDIPQGISFLMSLLS